MAKNGKRSKKWIVITLVVLTTLGGAGFALRGALKTDPKIDATKLVIVEKGDLARSVVATGKIQPRSKVEVKSKASGIVKKLLVDYGDWVKAGQVLAELDKEELQARMREAQAFLQAAQAAEDSAQASFERNKVEAEGPEIPFLKSAADRAKKLYSQGLIASNSLEDADKAYQMALHKQASAQRNVAVARADMAKAKAQVAQAQAAMERADEDLRNSTIVSPMDGLVLSRNVEVGDAVSSILVLGSQATLVMTLGDVGDVYVLGKVDQADIGRVYMGQTARIVVESFKDRKFEGQVTKISPLGVEKDNVTTFEVRVSIKNPGGELKANMTANAEIILEEKKGILLIPENAVIYDRQRKSFVEIPDATAEKGKTKLPVQLGISNGVKTQLMAGLKEGQQVILQ
jgi:HlyD family secretion protein